MHRPTNDRPHHTPPVSLLGSRWIGAYSREWTVVRVEGDPSRPDFCTVHLRHDAGDGLDHTTRVLLVTLRKFYREVTP